LPVSGINSGGGNLRFGQLAKISLVHWVLEAVRTTHTLAILYQEWATPKNEAKSKLGALPHTGMLPGAGCQGLP